MTTLVRFAFLLIIFMAFLADIALGVPLDPLSTFCTANPTECRKGSVSLLTVRGSGTNEYYVLEADPTTGEIPVAAAITLPNDTDYGTPTANTLRSAAMLGVGSTAVSNSNPVPISDAGGSITVDSVGRAYADSTRNDYTGTNVTTGAWVQVLASTAATINALLIDDTCGQVLELGTGGPGVETRKLLIPRGGLAGPIPLAIPSGTRLSLRAVSADCTTGDFLLTGLN